MDFKLMFPRFPFVPEAEEFLRNCSDIGITEQLRSRRISHVKIIPLLMSNGGLGLGDDDNFFVAIDKELSPANQAMALGHELGHTFHHDLKTIPPANVLPEMQREEVEEFCKLFAGQWLQKVGVDGIAKRFENESELITLGTVFALP